MVGNDAQEVDVAVGLVRRAIADGRFPGTIMDTAFPECLRDIGCTTERPSEVLANLIADGDLVRLDTNRLAIGGNLPGERLNTATVGQGEGAGEEPPIEPMPDNTPAMGDIEARLLVLVRHPVVLSLLMSVHAQVLAQEARLFVKYADDAALKHAQALLRLLSADPAALEEVIDLLTDSLPNGLEQAFLPGPLQRWLASTMSAQMARLGVQRPLIQSFVEIGVGIIKMEGPANRLIRAVRLECRPSKASIDAVTERLCGAIDSRSTASVETEVHALYRLYREAIPDAVERLAIHLGV